MNTPIFTYTTEPELLQAFARLVSISSNFLFDSPIAMKPPRITARSESDTAENNCSIFFTGRFQKLGKRGQLPCMVIEAICLRPVKLDIILVGLVRVLFANQHSIWRFKERKTVDRI